jgi:phosphoribosylaminoimidazole-succinocarboxamide synthase
VRTLLESSIASLPLVGRGKVRDIYGVGADQLLIVTTDRLSAYDVILPTPVPEKGRVLTELANFWFGKLAHIVPNHLTGIDPESVVRPDEREQVRGRSVVVRRLTPLPIEAVVRGYLEGSGWKEYQESGAVCGIALPPGLARASRLPEPIFTPATKAEAGHHDENISFERVASMLGERRAREVRETAIALYQAAAAYALERGIIIADTKFEFGVDGEDRLFLIDEALTPDSSRFWPLAKWREGTSPESFDKQYVRNWLDSIGFERKPPAPAMPPEVARRTSEKYLEALKRLVA